MDRPLTEVQKFIKETQRQIDEEGLVGMSGTHFDRGDPIRRVLKAKQFEYRLYSGGMKEMINPDGTQNRRIRKGKFASVATIAKDLNAMNQAIKDGNFVPYVDDVESYMDDVSEILSTDKSFKFNDSRKKHVERVLQAKHDGKTKPYYDY